MTTLDVYGFGDERAPASRLAVALGAPMSIVPVHRFPDAETRPQVAAPAAETVVIYRSLDRPNGKLVDLLLTADALRRAGARRVILVAPYFCYLRQDAVFAPGEPLSRDVIAPIIGRAFDAVVTVQAHLHRTGDLSALLGVPTANLIPVEALAAALPAYDGPPLILGPDQESSPWVNAWAAQLGGEPMTLAKTRFGDRHVKAASDARLAEAAGRAVVIVDDIASSGVTLVKALLLLRQIGAASVDIAVTHAMTPPRVTAALTAGGARCIVSTDSIRHSTNAAALAPLLASAVQSIRSRL